MTSFRFLVLAYLDPVTGSLLLQVAVAFVVGLGVMLRRYLFMPLGWVLRRKRGKPDTLDDLYE